MNYHIAVLDLGKTNKKIAIFSKDLKLIYSRSLKVGERTVKGLRTDNMDEVNKWIIRSFKELSKHYNIKVVSPTTFGATIACLKKDGTLALPVISYLQEPGNVVRSRFYKTFGSSEKLYLSTAAPAFGQMLVAAIQIFWTKRTKPEVFRKIDKILFLPQYEGFMLTGKTAIELTSLGCHTYLYDFKSKNYSFVAKKLGSDKIFPKKFSNSWDMLGTINKETVDKTGLSEACKVTVGIHDSNASFLPYLLAKKGKFVLASTGTWGVFMSRGSKFYLNKEDMKRDALYFIDAFGKPVRSARFPLGKEHDHYSDLITKKFKVIAHKTELHHGLVKKIFINANCFVTPSLLKGSGQFPDSRPKIVNKEIFFSDAQTAYTVLNVCLAVQSYFAIKQALGNEKKNIPIFVEGGFRNNSIYLTALSTLFPDTKVIATDVAQATSLGAAICGKCAAENISPMKIKKDLIKIKENPVKKLSIDKKFVENYIKEFEKNCK